MNSGDASFIGNVAAYLIHLQQRRWAKTLTPEDHAYDKKDYLLRLHSERMTHYKRQILRRVFVSRLGRTRVPRYTR